MPPSRKRPLPVRLYQTALLAPYLNGFTVYLTVGDWYAMCLVSKNIKDMVRQVPMSFIRDLTLAGIVEIAPKIKIEEFTLCLEEGEGGALSTFPVADLCGSLTAFELIMHFDEPWNARVLVGLHALKRLVVRGLKSKRWSPQALKSLQGVEGLDKLESVGLYYLSGLGQIGQLGEVTGLKDLTLSHITALADIRSVGNLTNLNSLTIIRSNVHNFEILAGQLHSLTMLIMKDCHFLKSVAWIGTFLSLTTLNLDLLIEETNAEHAEFGLAPQVAIRDLSGLAALSNLERFSLKNFKGHECELYSIVNNTNLRILLLRNIAELTNLEFVQQFTLLHNFHVGHCPQLTQANHLSRDKPGSVVQLHLANNQLLPFDTLKNFYNLRSLYMSEWPRESLHSFHAPLLQVLTLKNHLSLKNIDPVGGCNNLRKIRLTNLPELENVDCLTMLQHLHTIRISKCPKIPQGAALGQRLDALTDS